MNQEVVKDPRHGMFTTLTLLDGETLNGPWSFHHNGFGDHNFIHEVSGNFVPPTAVKIATR
jgi:hypothetical protein